VIGGLVEYVGPAPDEHIIARYNPGDVLRVVAVGPYPDERYHDSAIIVVRGDGYEDLVWPEEVRPIAGCS